MTFTLRLSWKAKPPPTCGVNRGSGTASANGSGDVLGGGVICRQVKA